MVTKNIYIFSIRISDHGSFDLTGSGITIAINLIIGMFEKKNPTIKKKQHTKIIKKKHTKLPYLYDMK